MRIDYVKLIAEIKRQDLTQKKLAELAGVSVGTINGISAGRKCSVASAEKIAKALSMDVSELI